MVMEMVMEKRVMKVVYQVIEDHQALKEYKDLQVCKGFKGLEGFKVIEVYKDPWVDRVYKVYAGIPGERGPCGFRGPQGHIAAVPAGQPQTGSNITTLDTTGLETSFQAVGDAMNQLAQQQQIANAQLNQSLLQQQHKRGHMVAVMDRVGNATIQSSY